MSKSVVFTNHESPGCLDSSATELLERHGRQVVESGNWSDYPEWFGNLSAAEYCSRRSNLVVISDDDPVSSGQETKTRRIIVAAHHVKRQHNSS